MAKIRLICLASGGKTYADGQYVVEYDPTKPGVSPEGIPMFAHLVTTPDPDEAKVYESPAEALKAWRLQHGLRPDGLPNRPLTAYTVEIV